MVVTVKEVYVKLMDEELMGEKLMAAKKLVMRKGRVAELVWLDTFPSLLNSCFFYLIDINMLRC